MITPLIASPYCALNEPIITDNSGYHGGGIKSGSDGVVIINNVLIYNNQSYDYGGGIFIHNEAEMSIYNSTVFDNLGQNAGGAQIEGIANVENCIFYGNQITGGGCGGTGDG